MLKRRPTQPFKLVCLTDPALDAIPEHAIEKYAATRNIDDLPLELCSEKPTVFHCWPMRPEDEHLMSDPDPNVLWTLFRKYVYQIENFDLNGVNPWDPSSGRSKMKDSARELFHPDEVHEVALAVQQWASRFDARPFSSVDIWRSERKKRALHGVQNAITETVNKTLSS